jgi:hypothetical protein
LPGRNRTRDCRTAALDMLILSLLAGQHEVIAENLSTAVVADLSSLVKSLKDDRRKVGIYSLFLSVADLNPNLDPDP